MNLEIGLISFLWVFITDLKAHSSQKEILIPYWAVKITGGDVIASNVANDYGFINRGKILKDIYHFELSTPLEEIISIEMLLENAVENLERDERVLSTQQQTAQIRRKRYFVPIKDTRANDLILKDPKWPAMWYLNRGKGRDLNVIPVWIKGITGKGVVVAVVDDGMKTNHRDLSKNYDKDASWDFIDNDAFPTPGNLEEDNHGTSCAGIIAATNNTFCGIGIAFNAKIGALRILSESNKIPFHQDAIEAAALSFNNQYIDIYSNSWGGEDEGTSIDRVMELTTLALETGVNEGRQGKGNIFVWASGNGGAQFDNCNCDGYVNSIYTLAVAGANEDGESITFSEPCTATMTTTFSGYDDFENRIITTTAGESECTDSFSGTSASTPMVAGVIALALEANPNLTWRDVQHIVVRASDPSVVGDASEWITNGARRQVSYYFGFGLLDANAMVNLAKAWNNVPAQRKCEIKFTAFTEKVIKASTSEKFKMNVGKKCADIKYLEHVQAILSIKAQRRGKIEVYLTSPSGTRSCLLGKRKLDWSGEGFVDWPFMSVHNWGENPKGDWTLEVHNRGHHTRPVKAVSWTLVLYGTDSLPASASDKSLLLDKETVENNSFEGDEDD